MSANNAGLMYTQITIKSDIHLFKYHRRLMGSRLIESAAYCNQIWLAHLYINSAQNTSVN